MRNLIIKKVKPENNKHTQVRPVEVSQSNYPSGADYGQSDNAPVSSASKNVYHTSQVNICVGAVKWLLSQIGLIRLNRAIK